MKKKSFTLTELLVVSLIIVVLATSAISSYHYYIKSCVTSVLKNAVIVNISLIQIYYDTHGYWPTDADPENPNLTTDEELRKYGLAARNLSQDFMMRVFKKDGFPNIIAREKIGQNKYGIIVNYHFKIKKLEVNYE